MLVYLGISAAILLAAGGHEQELVLFYAVAVFVSFLAGLAAMARFSLRDGRRGLFAINLVGAVAVAFTLIVNLGRGYPLALARRHRPDRRRALRPLDTSRTTLRGGRARGPHRR